MDEPMIFIVDDDPGVRGAMARMLQHHGWSTRSFESAEAFLDGYRSGQPGCLLLDLYLPGMSGATLIETLVERGCCLPVILITGDSDDRLARRAAEAGAFAVLAKPFRRATLVPLVEQALDRG